MDGGLLLERGNPDARARCCVSSCVQMLPIEKSNPCDRERLWCALGGVCVLLLLCVGVSIMLACSADWNDGPSDKS